MSSATLNSVSYVHLTLLTNTDKGKRLLHTGEYSGTNRATLVNNHTGDDTALLKELNNTVRAVAGNLFITTEGEIDVILRNKALVDKLLCRLKNTV